MPGMQAHFQLAFDVHLLEMLTARELSSHFAESCKYQTEKIRTLVHVSGSAEAPLVTVGSVILKTFRSVHFHPTRFTRPSFQLSKMVIPLKCYWDSLDHYCNEY